MLCVVRKLRRRKLCSSRLRLIWAVPFIRMPMPKPVCRTNLCSKIVELEVCRTFSGRGMGINGTAHYHYSIVMITMIFIIIIVINIIIIIIIISSSSSSSGSSGSSSSSSSSSGSMITQKVKSISYVIFLTMIATCSYFVVY